MVTKIVAVLGLVAVGYALVRPAAAGPSPLLDRPPSFALASAVGAALVPVLFAYGGWQTASFVAAELRRPERDLPRGLLLGVAGVILLYLTVNAVCVRALGAEGLAATTTPASSVMRLALGDRGASLIAAAITVSTLGFLSQGILTAPRVYYAMAEDGVFFRAVGFLHPRTLVPVVAIALQGLVAAVIAVSGRYEQILNYVVSVDFIFFGATGASLFVFRRRQGAAASFRTPGHPATTIFFVAACFLVVINTVYTYPANSVIGLGILLAGVPIFFLWRRRR
jgi:APA family basic amino acid/polyamine antiporter